MEYGVWKLGQKRTETPIFTGTYDEAVRWSKERHADSGPFHVRETIASLEARGIPYKYTP